MARALGPLTYRDTLVERVYRLDYWGGRDSGPARRTAERIVDEVVLREVAVLRAETEAARALVQDWRERHGILAHVRAADELEAALRLEGGGSS